MKIQIPEEFERLLDDDWREAAVYGGRYSLKSHTVARYLLIRARQKRTRIGCFREYQNSIADSSHQLLSDLIKQYELHDFKVTDNSIINQVTGSNFIFRGLHKNEQAIKSTEGLDIAWVEEAQTVSQASLEILTPTIRTENSQIIYTYNRMLDEDPVHKRLVLEGRPNTLVLKIDYTVALKYGFMPDNIRLEMEDDKARRPGLFKHKWLGEPETVIEGKILNYRTIDGVPEQARYEGPGLDFGYNPDPAVIVNIYYLNGEYIIDEVVYGNYLQNRELATILKNQPPAVCVADSAEPKSIDEIKGYGLNIIGTLKGADSRRYRIKTLQALKIAITRRSQNTIKEFNNFRQAVDRRTGAIIMGEYEGADHAIDAASYKICSLIPIQQRKEMIMNLPTIPRQKQTNPAF